jgi:hypothetical protein
MPLSSMLALRLGPMPEGYGTGLEWMPLASVVAALVVLIVIAWFGSRNTV